MSLLTPRTAAERMGIRYSTLKQAIHQGKRRPPRIAALLAQVRLRIGDQTLTAVITTDALNDLKLRRGDDALAIIKSTEVMIAREADRSEAPVRRRRRVRR